MGCPGHGSGCRCASGWNGCGVAGWSHDRPAHCHPRADLVGAAALIDLPRALVLLLRGLRGAGALRPDPAGAGHSGQAVHSRLRLSESTSLRPEDLRVDGRAHVRVIGKGRKEWCTPLGKNRRAVLAAWAGEPPRTGNQPLFRNARGGKLSSHGVHCLPSKHLATATAQCPSMKNKRVSPHVLRHLSEQTEI